MRRDVLTLLALLAAGCDGATEPQAAPVRLTAVTETSLDGTVGAELVPAPTVRALDADGRGVAGVAVTFEVADGAGSIARSAVETDADGVAGVSRWTLGPAVGAQTLAARAAGLADVVFTATAAAGPVARIVPLAGNGMIAPAGEPLEAALRVRVTDAYGNGIAGAPVTFTVTSGGGSIAPETSLTDGAGEAASGVWTLGPASGEQQVRVTCETVAATITAFAITSISGLEGRLAFVSEADDNADIYALNADGSGLARLTTGPADDVQPVWEPGGSRIHFVRRTARQSQIFSMAADGGDVMGPMVDPSIVEDPALSPDGFVLAYSSLRDGSAQVVSLDTRTGHGAVLVGNPGYDAQPSWSPDGRRLAFVSDDVAYDFVFDIYTMNADGTNQVRLTQGFDLGPRGIRYYLHPAWSPDGTLIAFVWGEFLSRDIPATLGFHVAVMAPDGSGVRDLAVAGVIRNAVHDPGSLAWSPDGRGIAFSFAECVGPVGAGCAIRSVKFVPLDGGPAITLIPNGHSPSWR